MSVAISQVKAIVVWISVTAAEVVNTGQTLCVFETRANRAL